MDSTDTATAAAAELDRHHEGICIPGELDAVDRKILILLQRDASLSTADLAERVGISQSPCWRRLRRLRDTGYIKSTVAIVDPRKVGYTMQIFAQLKISQMTPEMRSELERQVDQIPEIVECYMILGEMDIMMKVLAIDTVGYQDFLLSVIMKLPGVKDVHSIVTLADAKSTTAIPLSVTRFRPGSP